MNRYKNIIISNLYFSFLVLSAMLVSSCHRAPAESADDDASVQAIVPVKIQPVVKGPISESIELNANTAFIKKYVIRSNTNGYIVKINAQLGDQVGKGETVFVMKTKEANALGNTIFPNDTSLRFSGLIPIRASQPGFIVSMSHQLGDYVLEGDSLCSVVGQNSLVFLLNVPYEWNADVKVGQTCEISLSDGRTFNGTVYSRMVTMDASSQTQSYLLRADTQILLPENLIAHVKIYKQMKADVLLVPKAAVLSNEEQTEFWVMRMNTDSSAVKVVVKKGMETNSQTEVLESSLKPGEQVLVSGNYGMADTSLVKVEK